VDIHTSIRALILHCTHEAKVGEVFPPGQPDDPADFLDGRTIEPSQRTLFHLEACENLWSKVIITVSLLLERSKCMEYGRLQIPHPQPSGKGQKVLPD